MKKNLIETLLLSKNVRLGLTLTFLFFTSLFVFSQPPIEWSKVIGGTLNDIPQAVVTTSVGDYVVIGDSNSSDGDMQINQGKTDLWVIRFDEFGEKIWEKNFGGSENDFGIDIQQTTDGGFVIVGGTASNDSDITQNYGETDVWVLKINAAGVLQWSKTYGGVGVDLGTSILTQADGFMIAGCTGSSGDPGVTAGYGGNDFWILKLDLNGDLVWEKTYGGSRHDVAKKILSTDDSGFLIGGNSWSLDGDVSTALGKGDVWMIKIDEAGELLWEKNFGSDTPEVLNDLKKTTDGNFILAGGQSQFDHQGNGFTGRYDEQMWILKFSPSGQILWEKNFGGEKYDAALSVEPTFDGGYLIGSNLRSNDGAYMNQVGHDDIFLMKTDSAGNELWSKIIGGNENEKVKSIIQTDDSGFLMLGFSNSIFVDTTFVKIGFEDWWLIKYGGSLINVNLGNNQTVCQGEEISLNAYLPGCDCSYSWSTGSTDSVLQISLTETAMVSVTVTDPAGVEGTDFVTIFVSNPNYTLESEDVICPDFETGSANLNTQGVLYNYQWNTGATTSGISELSAGTYTFTITDANQCSETGEVTINEPAQISTTIDITEVSCYEGNSGNIDLSVSGGNGGFTYEWSNGKFTQDIDGLTAGGYTVTITDAQGCLKNQDWVVNQPSQINITGNSFPTQCFDTNDGGAIMTINGGVENYTYEWSNNTFEKDLENVVAGTYTLTVTDGNGCKQSTSIEISNPSEIMITTNVQSASCFGNNDGAITTDVEGGTGNYQYQWSNNASTPDISQLSSGTYTLTVIDANQCQKIQEVILSQNTDITIASQITPITCFDSEDGAIDISVTGGTGFFDFDWNNSSSSEDINNLPAGDYILTVTDSDGCESVELFTIDALDSIEIISTAFDANCFGASDGFIQTEAIGGNGNFEYAWSNNIFTSSNLNIPAGNYTLTVTDFKGCENVETFEITQPDSIIITPTITEVSCYGFSDGAIDVWVEGGAGGYFIDWSGGANSNLPSGDYSITVTDLNNCFAIEDVFVPQPDSLSATFQITNPNTGDDGSILTQIEGGTPPYTFNWNNNEWTEGDIFDLAGGNYDLIVTDSNGCVFEESIFLEPLSIFEIENLNTFNIFPNPTNGTFFLQIEFEKRENVEITITNELGQVIQRWLRNDNYILEKNSLPQITAGIYFIQIKTANGVATKRLIVQN